MKIRTIFLTVFCLIVASYKTIAQEKIDLTIHFPSNWDTKRINLYIYDGTGSYEKIKDSIQNNQIRIQKKFYSKYATISVNYQEQESSFSTSFWVSEKPSIIQLVQQESNIKPLIKTVLSNAYELSSLEEEKRLNDFIILEFSDLQSFLAKNTDWPTKDSLIAVFETKSKKLSDKKIEFVRKNGNSYYSFWLFGKELIHADYTNANADTLTNIYNSVFPANFKNTMEDTEIVKVLYGRGLKKGKIAPDFTMKDISGKTVSLVNCKGKYTILNFWASWCAPCIKEFPAIRKMRETYKKDKLEIISFSNDSDSLKFKDAIKKYQMNWTHVMSDINLLKTYAIIGIPVVYLIDQKGEIIYSRDEEKDFELDVLSKILAKKLQD